MTELKPCPFCGADIGHWSYDRESATVTVLSHPPGRCILNRSASAANGARNSTWNASLRFPYDTPYSEVPSADDLVEAWNSRVGVVTPRKMCANCTFFRHRADGEGICRVRDEDPMFNDECGCWCGEYHRSGYSMYQFLVCVMDGELDRIRDCERRLRIPVRLKPELLPEVHDEVERVIAESCDGEGTVDWRRDSPLFKCIGGRLCTEDRALDWIHSRCRAPSKYEDEYKKRKDAVHEILEFEHPVVYSRHTPEQTDELEARYVAKDLVKAIDVLISIRQVLEDAVDRFAEGLDRKLAELDNGEEVEE